MHRRSYTDPTCGAVIVVFPDADDPRLRAVLDKYPIGSPEPASALNDDLLTEAMQTMPGTIIHEWMHILQAAAYPLLYLRTARALRLIDAPWNGLFQNPGRYPLPTRLVTHTKLKSSRLVETEPQVIEIGNESVAVHPATANQIRGRISENDLVEEDAAIAQYRIEIGGEGDGADYHGWLSHRSSYHAIFSYLRRRVGDDDALALIPIAARIAFRTTRPLLALAQIVDIGQRNGGFGFSDSGDAFWENLLRAMVYGTMPPLDISAHGWDQETVDDPLAVIDNEAHGRVVAETSILPISPLARWELLDGGASDILRNPWEHIRLEAGSTSDVAGKYFPPAIVFETVDPPRVSIGFGSSISDLGPTPDDTGTTYPNLIPILLRMKQMIDVQIGDRLPLRTCPHEQCKYHGTRLCDGWFPIPRDFEKCTFPWLFEHQTGHTVAENRRALVPIQDQRKERSWISSSKATLSRLNGFGGRSSKRSDGTQNLNQTTP